MSYQISVFGFFWFEFISCEGRGQKSRFALSKDPHLLALHTALRRELGKQG